MARGVLRPGKKTPPKTTVKGNAIGAAGATREVQSISRRQRVGEANLLDDRACFRLPGFDTRLMPRYVSNLTVLDGYVEMESSLAGSRGVPARVAVGKLRALVAALRFQHSFVKAARKSVVV
jgi:hypothetical protein